MLQEPSSRKVPAWGHLASLAFSWEYTQHQYAFLCYYFGQFSNFSSPRLHCSIGDRSDLRLQMLHLRPPLRLSFVLLIYIIYLKVSKSGLRFRATLASVSLFTAGTNAWYTHLYGNLPFIGGAHASHLSDEGLHPPAYPWPHKGILDTFDHARFDFICLYPG